MPTPTVEPGAWVGRRPADTVVVGVSTAPIGMPVIVSEQYPKGLGPTVSELGEALDGARVIEKTAFDCSAVPEIVSALEAAGRRQVVLAGMEAHICVLQTALGLKAQGYEVAVAADAVGSRRTDSRDRGLARLSANGVAIAESEMVLFEWLGSAEHPQFREIVRSVK